MICGILGSSGFLGTHVVNEFTNNNINIIHGSKSNGVDATDLSSLNRWINNHHITHIVNLAAYCGGIGLNQSQPYDLWNVTTKIINTVLEACINHKIQKLIQIGTVCSYANNCPTPFFENYLMCYGYPEITNAPYGVAKLNGLFGAIAARKQYGLKTTYLIPVNLYGPNDHFDDSRSHVIPAIIKKCVKACINNQKQITCWGSGFATREFLYVKDAARAIRMALLSSYDSELPLNIGTGNAVSIGSLAIMIADATGFAGEICWDKSKPDGQPQRRLNVDAIERSMGFRAATALKDGLLDTISWYLEHEYGMKCDDLINKT